MEAGARYFFREVTQSFKRNLLLNLSSISTVMVLTFQLGFFILLIANINNFTSIALDKLQITVFLSPRLSLEKAGKLKHRIMKHPDVEAARYISKEKALRRLKERMKGKIDLKTITRNPLPDSIELELKDPDKIEEVAEEIKKYPGVDGVQYGDKSLTDKLIKLSNRIYTVGIAIISMLLVSAVFLIFNTIKLTVYSRRREIEIMELVGAARWFIRGPFLTEGLIHGLFGSCISIILLNALYSVVVGWVIEDLPFIPILPPGQAILDLSLFLLAVGIIVGSVSSYVAVNRYLKI